MRRASIVLTALPVLALSLSAASDARTAAADPAQRGLDVFVHGPDAAAPGDRVSMSIEAYGFPTAVTLAPLPSATVEAAWDPEQLGPGVTSAPPAVKVITDTAGRAHLEVPVPDGDERALSLLIGVRHGDHTRTRTVSIKRGPAHAVGLHVAETTVVPGSSVSAWALVTQAASGEPVAGAPVEVALIEGGMPRFTIKLVTDAAGTAMTRVPIPEISEPSWSWTLRARSLGAGNVVSARSAKARASGAGERGAGEATVTLSPREETPGKPTLTFAFGPDAVLAGEKAPFTMRLRDANGLPVAGQLVRWWVGPKGTEPPKEADWDRLTASARTNAEGEINASADAPPVVVAGAGTHLKLVARTEVEGHVLSQSSAISVGAPTSTATLSPEAGSIVPGVEQRVLLRVRDGHNKPVAATFAVEGDGLAATVTTSADGEAELSWHPPAEVGALRQVGPCAGGVAAAVVVRPMGDVPALKARREPFRLCAPIDREATALVKIDRPIARAGEKVRVRVIEADPRPRAPRPDPGKRGYSVLLRSPRGDQAAAAWIEDGERGGEIEVPSGEPGAWSISAAAPGTSSAATLAGGAILITPRVLPKLSARVAGGRAVPGGAVDVEADLADEKGQPLVGTVAAVVVDLHGGGSTEGLERLDARRSLCRPLGVEDARCDRFVEGDPALDGLRRASLGEGEKRPHPPALDPAGSARAELTRTFGEVLRSLEGAVFEATQSADRLSDARRRGARGYTWNPELMSLVTAALPAPPLTPGGEPITLTDLIAIDPQVTFDNVARRVTRLKLFRVLAAVRAFRHEHALDPDEPVLRDPNALLRKLVREDKLTEDQLLDPWGGTIRFVPARGPALPFLSVVRGFELHAPGPDGVAGNGDDVKDPFERVLKSDTPYAKAMQEDRLVDARFDMEVSESTVSAWQRALEELTGTSLGNAGGLGLHGVGEGGGGGGFGSGHGRLGGSHRRSAAITSGVHWWSPPVRTDDRGRVRFRVPLGDAETTWRVALVAVPDGARQATTHVDVGVSIPLSARVDTGARWVEGDRVEASVIVRNRSAKAAHARLSIAASGAARVDAKDAAREVDVAANSAAVVRVPVEAPAAGSAALVVTVRAADLPEDVAHHSFEVAPAGEPTDLTRAQWVEGSATLAVPIEPEAEAKKAGVPAMRLVGQPRLVLERGLRRPLAAALESMSPDKLRSRAALLDAIEVAARVGRWAVATEGDGSPIAARAAEIVRHARGRIVAFGKGAGAAEWSVKARLKLWVPPEKPEPSARPECPPANDRDDDITTLDVEATESGVALSCWDALVSNAMEQVTTSGDAVTLARALLAVAERPHRAALAGSLADRLREKVALKPSGAITLSEREARHRASRAVVYAALLRTAQLGKPIVATPARLSAWIAVQRDADGGYGSALATRSVVRALLASSPSDAATTRVSIKAGALQKEVEVPANTRVEVPLPAGAAAAEVEVQGPALLVRLERPVVRPWSRPAEGAESPLALDATWPSDARADRAGVLSLSVRHTRARPTVADLRIPLPPGVSLAEPVDGVRQVQGTLLVRRSLDGSGLPVQIELPVRFGLAGRFTVPEAEAVVAHDESPRALAPARPLVVR